MTKELLTLGCRGCGSKLDYSAKDESLKCPYCGTVTEIPKVEPEYPDEADSIIPLKVEVSELTDMVYEHLASGPMTPDHLLEHATFTKTERLYVPVYLYQGDFDATWTASFGYDRQEQYTVYEKQTQNGHTRTVPVTKTKTVTDWRPVNGSDTGSFNVFAYAGQQLFGETVDAAGFVERKVAGKFVPFDRSYLESIPIEKFVATADGAYSSRANSQVNEVIEAGVKQHAQGDRQRDWHWSASTSKTSYTVLVPLCHAVYEFEGKSYNVWLSGSDASTLIADPLPVDPDRKKAVSRGFIPLWLSLVASGFAFFKFDSGWQWPLAVIAIAALYAFLRKSSIIDYSVALRQALLAGRRAANTNTSEMSASQQHALSQKVKRPTKGWLANTSADAIVVPLVALSAALVPFSDSLKSFTFPTSNSSQVMAQATDTPVQASAMVASPVSVAPPAPEAPVAPIEIAPVAAVVGPVESSPVPAVTEIIASTASQVLVPVNVSAPQQSTPAPKSGTPDIVAMLSAAKQADWRLVDEQSEMLLGRLQAVMPVDRSAARAANNEGLEAFKKGDFGLAAQSFERATNMDAGNVEYSNNLGYAFMKGKRDTEALRVISGVLLEAPNRSSAWANLSELLVAKPEVADSALRLAAHFSANRQRTIVAFQKLTETHPDERYRKVVMGVLMALDGIPKGPNEH